MKEFKEAMSQQKPMVIMFHAPWCGACKEMSGALNQAATQLGSQATVVKIDVENEDMHELTDLFCINAIPTIVVKHTGRVLAEDLVSSVKSLTKKPTLEPKKNELTKKETPEKKADHAGYRSRHLKEKLLLNSQSKNNKAPLKNSLPHDCIS